MKLLLLMVAFLRLLLLLLLLLDWLIPSRLFPSDGCGGDCHEFVDFEGIGGIG